MSCNGNTYNIGMGCCQPVLGPIENYYTKYQVDNLLDGKLDVSAYTGIVEAEASARTEADEALQAQIDVVSGNVNTESERAISAETALQNAIDNEVSARTSADEALQGNIDVVSGNVISENNRAISAETALDNKIDQEIIDRAADVDAEEARAISAETVLQNAIVNEASARTESDETLQDNIDVVSGNVNTESERAISAETALQNAIDSEATARTEADDVLQGNIDIVSGNVITESDRATSAETALQTAIENEASARTEADEALQAQIDVVSGNVITESDRAISAETALQDAIDAEASARTSADTVLQDNIDAEEARAISVEATKADKASAVASAEYLSSNKIIYFKNISGTIISYIDATDFIKDGMVNDVYVKVSSGVSYLAITFNSDSGKEEIDIPLTDIFNPNNYYTKLETDNAISAATNDMATKTWVENKHYITGVDLSNYATTAYVNGVASTKADTTAVTQAISEAVSSKADASDVEVISGNVQALSAEVETIIISGGGVTSGIVQTMIDEAVSGKTNQSDFSAHTANTNVHVTSQEKQTWNNKSDFSGNYNDLTNKPTIPTVPTNVSAFNNDAQYATSGYVNSAVSGKQDTLISGSNIKTINGESVLGSGNISISSSGGISSAECQTMINNSISGKADSSSLATVATSGNYNDLTNKPTIPTVPTSNTAFTNDAGYITSSDISGKTNQSDFSAHTANTTVHVTSTEKNTWNNKSDFSGNYNDLTNKPTIPNYTAGSGISITNNVISAKIWSGTITEYNALGTYSNDTIYLVY